MKKSKSKRKESFLLFAVLCATLLPHITAVELRKSSNNPFSDHEFVQPTQLADSNVKNKANVSNLWPPAHKHH